MKHVREVDIRNPVDLDGLFIDWVPKLPNYEQEWMKQASILQHYIKDIPIVIFDRYFSLSEREVNFIQKYNVKLFEPALNSDRYGFSYLPEWIDSLEIKTEYDDKREYDLIYPDLEYNIGEFEKWIVELSVLFPHNKVAYSNKVNISEFKKEEYRKKFLEAVSMEYESGKTTIAIDSHKAYKMGYFDVKYFKAMQYGCLPFLPIQHKYFHGLFDGLVFSDLKHLDLNISMFGKLRDVIIEEIFERIKNEWNEFTVDHAVDVIRKSYE